MRLPLCCGDMRKRALGVLSGASSALTLPASASNSRMASSVFLWCTHKCCFWARLPTTFIYLCSTMIICLYLYGASDPAQERAQTARCHQCDETLA